MTYTATAPLTTSDEIHPDQGVVQAYADEYLAARIGRHSATSMTAMHDAEETAAGVDEAAYEQGIHLDLIGLDDQAREIAAQLVSA